MQDTFLLDEVRCGFLIPAAIKQAWAAGLEVLMEIDRVCKKHNIQYFADWGTLLGTVRHGGYIPWDDDLDIVMKREDYIKFMTIARFDMEEGFDVQTFRNHEDCWLFMGKVVGRNGFCFEKEHLRRFHNFPYISCVDIFVLDYVYRDPEKEEKRRDLCKYMLAVANSITEEKLAHTDREYRLQMLEKKLGYSVSRIDDPVEMKRYLYGEIEKIFAEVPEQEADKLTQLFPWGLKGDWFQFPKEYYAESVSLPFEYTYMPVPKMYDKMLRQRYGDYVKLVKNAGAHGYPFFESQKENLQKVLDFELPEFRFDAAKMYRNEAEDACKALSYKSMAKTCLDELMRMKEEVAQMLEHEVNVTDASCMEQVLDLLAAGQQLAIDLGNMLEQFLGEDCSIISFLEQYCEIVYGIYSKISGESDETATDIDDLEAVLTAITDDMKRNIFARKTVLFLPVLAKDWDSLQGLWQEYTNNPAYDVFVVPLPYYYKDYDGSPKKLCYEITEFPSEIQTADYNLLTSEYLEMLHPEIIVIQNPYDSWNPAIAVPEMFYSLNLRKYTDDLIYVPPVEVEEYSKGNEREYSNMRYYVTMPGVVYADHVLVQSENMRQVYVERLVDFAGEETREVWEKTVIAKKLCDTEQEVDIPCRASDGEKSIISNSKKRMLYGISLGTYIADAETAQAKIERNLQVFEEYGKKMDVTMMIFPDSEESEPVREYLAVIAGKYPKININSCREIGYCAKDYDAYYGDVMPFVMEFRDAGKPVMIQDIYVG